MDTEPGSHRCQERLNIESSIVSYIFLCVLVSLRFCARAAAFSDMLNASSVF